jgi:bifunctional DNA-binding transcriptional regulator/antitoxin component of YhaV-PrlF toxin-antitoxin module
VDRVVGIRDGMLASETIRQNMEMNIATENGEAPVPGEEEHKYAELVVLDRAGRIHVPHEYLEQFDIKGHAQLEITEDGILIRQAAQTQTEQIKVDGGEGGTMMPRMGHTGAMTVKREKSGGGFFNRFRRNKDD